MLLFVTWLSAWFYYRIAGMMVMEKNALDLSRIGEMMDDPLCTTLWSWRWMEDDSMRDRYESRMRKRLSNDAFIVDAGLWMNEVIGRLLRLRAALSFEVEATILLLSRTTRGEVSELGSRVVGHDLSRIFYSFLVNTTWFVYKEELIQVSHSWNMKQVCCYRVTSDEQDALRIMREIQAGRMDEKGFFDSTDSLVPFLGQVLMFE